MKVNIARSLRNGAERNEASAEDDHTLDRALVLVAVLTNEVNVFVETGEEDHVAVLYDRLTIRYECLFATLDRDHVKGFVAQLLSPTQRTPHEDAPLAHLDTHEDECPVEELHIDSRPGVLEAVSNLLGGQLLRVDELVHA